MIEESVADKFVGMLVERARKYVVGDGLEPGTDMGPSVDESQFNTVLKYIEIGKGEGKLLCGGERLTGARYDKGWFVGADGVRSRGLGQQTSPGRNFRAGAERDSRERISTKR